MPTESSTAARKNPADYVIGFSSYREAEKAGYFSLKCLREFGLFVPDEVRPLYKAMVSTHYGRNCVYSREQCKAIKPGKTEDQSTHDRSIKDRQGNGYASITTEGCCCHELTATFLCDKYDSARHRKVYCPENFDPEGLPQETPPTEPKRRGRSTSSISSVSSNRGRGMSSSGRSTTTWRTRCRVSANG